MKRTRSRLRTETRQLMQQVFTKLDYRALAPIYCDEGGEAFWEDRRGPCERLGLTIAAALKDRLSSRGRSLYVGAGVAELPPLIMEVLDRQREVMAFNLRAQEVAILNAACHDLPLSFRAADARSAPGMFDHIWLVSVLNDPECFPMLSALSYGRANPVTFDVEAFSRERTMVFDLVAGCLQKLSCPGLITTSIEEIPWITDWCDRHAAAYVIDEATYPTALVGDPLCFMWIHGSARTETEPARRTPIRASSERVAPWAS